MREEDLEFVIAKESDIDRIWTFLTKFFFADEPITNGCGIMRGDSWFDKMMRKEVCKDIKRKSLMTPFSIMAVDKNNEIMGRENIIY